MKIISSFQMEIQTHIYSGRSEDIKINSRWILVGLLLAYVCIYTRRFIWRMSIIPDPGLQSNCLLIHKMWAKICFTMSPKWIEFDLNFHQITIQVPYAKKRSWHFYFNSLHHWIFAWIFFFQSLVTSSLLIIDFADYFDKQT